MRLRASVRACGCLRVCVCACVYAAAALLVCVRHPTSLAPPPPPSAVHLARATDADVSLLLAHRRRASACRSGVCRLVCVHVQVRACLALSLALHHCLLSWKSVRREEQVRVVCVCVCVMVTGSSVT